MPYMLAYALLFTAIGAGFIFIHLMIGKVVRPKRPDAEKLTVYECGEPTIGSAWVQFDLRFYVVALLFVIFDVEMAFFFPWAVVFGKTNQLAGDQITATKREEIARTLDPSFDKKLADIDLSLEKLNKAGAPEIPKTRKDLEEANNQLSKLTDENPAREAMVKRRDFLQDKLNRLEGVRDHSAEVTKYTQGPASHFTWVAFLDILVFFAVLLVGFAYLWRRGDLNWVRSTAAQRDTAEAEKPPLATIV